MEVVHRREFDYHLLRTAMARGLRAQDGAPIERIDRSSGGLVVGGPFGRWSVAALVGADGAQSTVRNRLLGHGVSGLCRLVEVVTPDPHPDERRDTVVFDFSAMKEGLQGYTWRFPCVVDGEPCLNWGVFDSGIAPRTGSLDLSAPLRAMMEREGVVLERSEIVGHPIRRFDPEGVFSADRAILVGDAAGVDPALGEGIALALDYGDLAATVLIDAFRRDDFSFSDYRDRLFAHPVGQSLLMRHAMAKKMYAPDGLGCEGAAEIMAHWLGQAARPDSPPQSGLASTPEPPDRRAIEVALEDDEAASSLSVILAASLLSMRPSWLRPDAAQNVLEIVEGLPDLVDSAGFEVRLAKNSPQVDLGVLLKRSSAILEHWREFAQRQRDSAAVTAAWRQIDRFLEEWSDPQSSIGEWVWSIFLEVDGVAQGDRLPCVFATFDWPLVESGRWTEECDRSWDVARHCLETLHSEPVDAPTLEMSRRCFEALPADGRVVHAGAMLGRGNAGIRLSIAVPRNALRPYLDAIGLDGEATLEQLCQYGFDQPRAHFACGVRNRCGDRLGFILAEPEAYAGLLDGGVRSGLCDPQKSAELLGWRGTTELGRDLLLRREISHFKLALGGERPPEIKAYATCRIESRRTA